MEMFSKRLVSGFLFFVFLLVCGLSLAHSQGLQPPQQEYALRFHEGALLTAPMSSSLNLGDSFTIEAWIYPERLGQCAFLIGKDDGLNGWYAIRYWDGALAIEQASPTYYGVAYYLSPQPFELRKWMHVAGTRDKTGGLHLYLNGVQVAQGQSSGPCEPNAAPLKIGSGGPGLGIGGFVGSVRQVRIWDYALEYWQILDNAGIDLTGNESGLIAFWPFDDGHGRSMRDLGPNNLTFQKSPAGPFEEWEIPLWVKTEALSSGPYLLAKQPIVYTGLCTLIDFDNDGDLDIVAPVGWDQLAFRNNGSNLFEDATYEVIVQYHGPLGGLSDYLVDDFNCDGRQDLLIVGEIILFIQSPGGQLIDETDSRFPVETIGRISAALGDVNGDGHIDIFMHNTFLINDGNGYFTSIPSGLPEDMQNEQVPFSSSALVDVDNDCDLDLLLGAGRDSLTNNVILLTNDGLGNFTNAPVRSMPPKAGGLNWGTAQIVGADFNSDGYQDLVIQIDPPEPDPEFKGNKLLLYINKCDGTFEDVSNLVPVDYPTSINRIVVGDFNSDGRTDIYRGGQAVARLYLNTGDPTGLFVDGTYLFGVPEGIATNWADHPSTYEAGYGRTVYSSCGDFEGDGDLDLVIVSHMGPVSIINHKPWPMPNPLPYPEKSDLISPQNASGHQTLPTLKWTGVVTAGSYQLQVATDQYFNNNNIVFDRNGLTCSSHQPATLIKGKTYYWQVRAINTRGAGPWSEVWNFYYGDIVPYTFKGFFSPIDNPPTVNKANAGQTIPVKWRLTDKNGLAVSDPASFKSLTSYGVNCATFGGATTDEVEEYAAGSSGLQYKGDGWWQYNWKTAKAYSGTCRTMKLTLGDNSVYTASFSFK